jgi:carboxypeptidase C (cathepsin A)
MPFCTECEIKPGFINEKCMIKAVPSESSSAFDPYEVASRPEYRYRAKKDKWERWSNSTIPPSYICRESSTKETGYVTVVEQQWFYWFSASEKDWRHAPLIFWLPGDDAMSAGSTAWFQANGPCHLTDFLSEERNHNAWTKFANVVWIDRPDGVGLSLRSDRKKPSYTELALWMFMFIKGWFQAHKQYRGHNVYLFGQADVGSFAPEMGKYILMHNIRWPRYRIALGGLILGNSVLSWTSQFKSYPQYAKENPYGVRLFTNKDIQHIHDRVLPSCLALVKWCTEGQGMWNLSATPKSASASCRKAKRWCSSFFPPRTHPWTHFNIFDIRKECHRLDGACIEGSVDNVRRYLSEESHRTSLGIAPSSVFNISLAAPVDSLFIPRFHIDRTDHTSSIVELLHNGVKVLVFAGDASYVSNYKGLFDTVKRMKWHGASAFNAAQDQVWVNNKKQPLGEVRTVQNLSFVRVYGAGHWVSHFGGGGFFPRQGNDFDIACTPLQAIQDKQDSTFALCKAFVVGSELPVDPSKTLATARLYAKRIEGYH